MKNKKTIISIVVVALAGALYFLDGQMGWGLFKSGSMVDTDPISETEFYRAELITHPPDNDGKSTFTVKLSAKTDLNISHLDASVVYYSKEKKSGSRTKRKRLSRNEVVEPFSLMDENSEMKSGETLEFGGYIERKSVSINNVTLIIEVDGYLLYPNNTAMEDFNSDDIFEDMEEIDKARAADPDNNKYDFLISGIAD